MYIHNGFEGYDMCECMENMLVVFRDVFSKKQRDLKVMWAIVAAFAHWLNLGILYYYGGLGDVERVEETMAMTGKAVLTMLNSWDRAGVPKPDSERNDLGLVISLYLDFNEGFGGSFDGEVLDWEYYVMAHARDNGISIGAVYTDKKFLQC